MKQPTECPSGTVYDAAEYAECSCLSCWAERSSARLQAPTTQSLSQDGFVPSDLEVSESGPVPSSFIKRDQEAEILANGDTVTSAVVVKIDLKERSIHFFKSFFSFMGRMNRLSYWTVIAIDTTLILALLIYIGRNAAINRAIITVLILLPALACFVSIVAACVKRLHDCDLSGFWAVFMLIGIPLKVVGSPVQITSTIPVIFVVGLGIINGSGGPNRFGRRPTGWLRIGRVASLGVEMVKSPNREDDQSGKPAIEASGTAHFAANKDSAVKNWRDLRSSRRILLVFAICLMPFTTYVSRNAWATFHHERVLVDLLNLLPVLLLLFVVLPLGLKERAERKRLGIEH